MCGWTHGSGHNVKMFVSHFNTHQKASTMEEALTNQEDKVTQQADVMCMMGTGSKGSRERGP